VHNARFADFEVFLSVPVFATPRRANGENDELLNVIPTIGIPKALVTFLVDPFIGIPIILNRTPLFIGTIVPSVREAITFGCPCQRSRAILVLIKFGDWKWFFYRFDVLEMKGIEVFAFAIIE